MTTTPDTPGMPTPHPALRALDRLIGRWEMVGGLVGTENEAGEQNMRGVAEFSWAPGGFFLQQKFNLDFMGMQIESLELVGYDAERGVYPSQVYSNMSPVPLPYTWEVDGDSITISVSYGPLDATFTGGFTPDGRFAGGWRPNPGADESVNVPYDISGSRMA